MPGKRRTLKKQLKNLRDKDTRWVERADADNKQSTSDGKTHFMSYTTVGEKGKEKYLVYPNVREKVDKFGVLKELGEDEAVDETFKQRDGLVFDKEKDAAWASEVGYKKYTNFPKQVVKDAKKDYKMRKKRKYTFGTAGVAAGMMSGAGKNMAAKSLGKGMLEGSKKGMVEGMEEAPSNTTPGFKTGMISDLIGTYAGIRGGDQGRKAAEVAGIVNNLESTGMSIATAKKPKAKKGMVVKKKMYRKGKGKAAC